MDLRSYDSRGEEMRNIRGNDIALIPQEPMAALSPVHTIGNQLVEAIRLHRNISKKEAEKVAVERMRQVGVPSPEERMDVYSWQLSGGLRQRVMIAMALMCDPRLLIADEPTTAIDVTTQAQVLSLLRELQSAQDLAMIFITHDLGVVAQIADYVVVMYLGKVVEQGPVDDIFPQPLPSLYQGSCWLRSQRSTLPHAKSCQPSAVRCLIRSIDLQVARFIHAAPHLFLEHVIKFRRP